MKAVLAAPGVSAPAESERSVFRLWINTLVLALTLITPPVALAETHSEPPRIRPEAFMDVLLKRAQALAETDFQQPVAKLPDTLVNMNYEQYRSINYKADAALWRNESLFEVQFFHPGFLYQQPVTVNVIEADGVHQRVEFSPALFDYRNASAPLAQSLPDQLGFAGLRVHFPLNSANTKDELLVFQGASYFRKVGPGQVYGLSARGIAVDTAEASGEEFPSFKEFWLVKPEADASTLVIFALLDSPSLTGAFRFELSPAEPDAMRVEAHLFARRDIKKLGIAPLTSMYFHGENRPQFIDDYRPEIHDSDGLLLHANEQDWTWRPLQNPRDLRITSLLASNPKGFGLLQRDRNFENYLDTEARYHERPSLWVNFDGDWAPGRVELVEIPTANETNDNIAAYWVSEQPLKAGQKQTYRYRLRSFDGRLPHHQLARVARTLNGRAALPGDDAPRRVRQFVVDFEGGHLQKLNAALPLQARIDSSSGQVSDINLSRLNDGTGWRLAFKAASQGSTPMDMRLHIALGDRQLSEVWSYVWYPDDIR